MSTMFEGATSFNADIGGWDTSEVEYMSDMFRGASAFNQDIRRWNVSNVRNFMYMFYGASEFNQNLSDWHRPAEGRVVKQTANKRDMFMESGLTQENRPSWLLPSLAALAPTGAPAGKAPRPSEPDGAPSAIILSDLPADVLEKVLLFLKDPCEVRFDHICSTTALSE